MDRKLCTMCAIAIAQHGMIATDSVHYQYYTNMGLLKILEEYDGTKVYRDMNHETLGLIAVARMGDYDLCLHHLALNPQVNQMTNPYQQSNRRY